MAGHILDGDPVRVAELLSGRGPKPRSRTVLKIARKPGVPFVFNPSNRRKRSASATTSLVAESLSPWSEIRQLTRNDGLVSGAYLEAVCGVL